MFGRRNPLLSTGIGLVIAGIGVKVGLEELREGLELGAHHGVMALGLLIGVRGVAEVLERLRDADEEIESKLGVAVRHPVIDFAVGGLLVVSGVAELLETAGGAAQASHYALPLVGMMALAHAYIMFSLANERLGSERARRWFAHRAVNYTVAAVLIGAALVDLVESAVPIGLHHAGPPLGLLHLAHASPAIRDAAKLASGGLASPEGR